MRGREEAGDENEFSSFSHFGCEGRGARKDSVDGQQGALVVVFKVLRSVLVWMLRQSPGTEREAADTAQVGG